MSHQLTFFKIKIQIFLRMNVLWINKEFQENYYPLIVF